MCFKQTFALSVTADLLDLDTQVKANADAISSNDTDIATNVTNITNAQNEVDAIEAFMEGLMEPMADVLFETAIGIKTDIKLGKDPIAITTNAIETTTL